MKKILFSLVALFVVGATVAFTLPEKKRSETKTYRYTEPDDSHVFDGVSPYWVETSPTYDCDPVDPTLPCTITLEIGEGGYANLDAFIDQFGSVGALMSQGNVTGKDE